MLQQICLRQYAAVYGFDVNAINNCATSREGTIKTRSLAREIRNPKAGRYLLAMAERVSRSLQPPYTSVPWIVINGFHHQSWDSNMDLAQAVCLTHLMQQQQVAGFHSANSWCY